MKYEQEDYLLEAAREKHCKVCNVRLDQDTEEDFCVDCEGN